MKIYITRHGKTIWNQEGRFQGSQDSSLLPQGIKDANDLGRYLENYDFDTIYSSPIGRAKNTSEIILKYKKVPITYDARLKEMNFGLWEGERIEDILEVDPYQYNLLWDYPEKFTSCPSGESYDQVNRRLKSFLDEIIQKNQDILIVTHGMIYVLLTAYFNGLDKKDYPKINRKIIRGCALSLVEYKNNQFEFIFEGNESYLDKDEVFNYSQK